MKRLALLLLMPVGIAYAGNGSGLINKIGVRQADVVVFNVENHTDKPDCNTVGDEWSISLATENGKSMYALLLSAAAQHKSVAVVGTGECQAWSDRETPLYIESTF